jgi:hypothetical protein
MDGRARWSGSPVGATGFGQYSDAQLSSLIEAERSGLSLMRAYQTSGHQPVAVAHAFIIIGPTSGVGTSAHAICGSILTLRGCRCFCR